MKGVSEVIAIILILMITISLAGLAYMFMSTTMSDVTASAGSTVDMTTSSMLTSFSIESIDIAKVYVRNTGQNALTGLSAYVNDELATFNVTPTSIATGAVGTVTIYSFIPDGATVKVTSPNGFSASKVAYPCEKAVGCWDFNDGTGSVAYDSSPNGNDGTISGASWTSGQHGSALYFNRASSNHVSTEINYSSTIGNEYTVEAMVKLADEALQWQGIIGDWNGGYHIHLGKKDTNVFSNHITISSSQYDCAGSRTIQKDKWYHVVSTVRLGGVMRLYINELIEHNVTIPAGSLSTSSGYLEIGSPYIGGITNNFNGTIDEVRIYNREIY